MQNVTIISEDHATLPWSVESKLMQYREAVKLKQESDEKELKMDVDDDIETANGNNNDPKVILKDILSEKSFASVQDPLDKSDANYVTSTFENSDILKRPNEIDYSKTMFVNELNKNSFVIERLSHKYHIYVNVENALITLHPCNKNYNFVLGNDYVEANKALYCVSKQYGVFYTNDNRSAIYHSNMRKEKFNVNKSERFEDPIVFDFSENKGNPSIQKGYLIESYNNIINDYNNENENEKKSDESVFMTVLNDPKFIPLDKSHIMQSFVLFCLLVWNDCVLI